MSYNIGDYTYISSYHEGKKGYVNKFEKAVKMPFFKALHNYLPNISSDDTDDLKNDPSEIAISDKIELSSAVVSASDVSDSDTGGVR